MEELGVRSSCTRHLIHLPTKGWPPPRLSRYKLQLGPRSRHLALPSRPMTDHVGNGIVAQFVKSTLKTHRRERTQFAHFAHHPSERALRKVFRFDRLEFKSRIP